MRAVHPERAIRTPGSGSSEHDPARQPPIIDPFRKDRWYRIPSSSVKDRRPFGDVRWGDRKTQDRWWPWQWWQCPKGARCDLKALLANGARRHRLPSSILSTSPKLGRAKALKARRFAGLTMC